MLVADDDGGGLGPVDGLGIGSGGFDSVPSLGSLDLDETDYLRDEADMDDRAGVDSIESLDELEDEARGTTLADAPPFQ